MHQRGLLFLAIVAASASPLGCHGAMRTDEAIAALHDPDPAQRQHAADALRSGGGVSPEAVPALLGALQTEQNPKVRGAILITLGRSGAPDAKPPIDQAVQTAADPETRRWASRALKYWMIQTGQVPADYKFPDGWPYGQQGFPPRLAAD